jgi:predicted secreted protein
VTDPESKLVILADTPEVHAKPGDPISVQVPAMGASGNVWTVQADPSHVRVLGHEKRPSETSFGGGGVEIFTVQPLDEGQTTVVFRLGAPWKREPAEKHELLIDVSNSSTPTSE